MAHHVESMDIDSDFDNKENSFHHNNVLPYTEKGYEELDVSELNMKLRYSVTPASSPMSKSYTANCPENRTLESGDESLNITVNENLSLTRSLNSTLTKNDNIGKTLKVLPLQAISTEQFVDSNRNTSVLRSIEPADTSNNGNVTVIVSGPSDIDENLSLPSSSSSALHTPEATTPTKDISIKDGGSPIMRGLKSVFNMFRSSQSPIPTADSDNIVKQGVLSPAEQSLSPQQNKSQAVSASTPISWHSKKEMSPTKRSSPQKDSSIVFNDDLERELQWKDETTIIFSQERIPIHKLLLQPQDKNVYKNATNVVENTLTQELNSNFEHMDISYNDSFNDRTLTEIPVDNPKAECTLSGESDGEFVDCETTFTKNKSTIEDNNIVPDANLTHDLNISKEIHNNNDSGSRLKPIILDTTQDILDATLSVRPEDLLPEKMDQTKDVPEAVWNKTETRSHETTSCTEINDLTSSLLGTMATFNQTVDIDNPMGLESQMDELVGLNCSKTTEATTNTQPNNETLNIASSLTNEQHQKGQLNVTEISENVLRATQVSENPSNITEEISNATLTLETNKIIDAEVGPVGNELVPKVELEVPISIDSINAVERPIVDSITLLEANSTFVNNISLTNEQHQKQNWDITETVETMTQPINETFDVTETSESAFGVTQVLENQHNISENINTQISNATVVLETNKSFHAVTSLINEKNQKEILEGTITEDTVIDITQIVGSQVDLSKTVTTQMSNTVVLEANKTFDAEISPLQDKANDFTPEIEFETAVSINSADANEVPIASIVAPVPLEDIIEPLPIPDDINIQDITMTELPVDIPLPDEDDLDKELNMSIDLSVDSIPIASLPLDLVDDIKVVTNICDTTNTKLEGTTIISNNNAVMLPEECTPTNISLVTDNILADSSIEINLTETDIAKEINSNLYKESDSTNLPVVISSPKNVAIEEVHVVDEEIEKHNIYEVNVESNAIKTKDANNTLENIVKDVIQNQAVVMLNNNENMSELKPLPDIINQTIALSNAENIGTSSSDPATELPEKVESNEEITGDLTGELIMPGVSSVDINDVNQEITTNIINVNTNDISNVIEETTPLTATADAIETQISSKIVTTPKTVGNALPENITDVVDSGIINTISIESLQADIIKEISNIGDKTQDIDDSKAKEVEEEIITSENNSPFVSVIADNIPDDKPHTAGGNVEDPFVAKTKVIITPPNSPPIRSKGYNFNFDDMDFDPFATKTNIRTSPSLDTLNKCSEINVRDTILVKPVPKKDINRRKSQPERRKPAAASKRKFNATIDGKINEKLSEKSIQKLETEAVADVRLKSPAIIALSPNNVTIEEKSDDQIDITPVIENVSRPILKTEGDILLQNSIEKHIEALTDVSDNGVESNLNELKPTSSSSEQSTYYSAGTTSSESSIPSRNVFNLPEIDDANFNPFATKSKMRQSPPPNIETDNPFATKSKIMASPDSSMIVIQKSDTICDKALCEDKIETELMEKDASDSLSNTSKVTDERNITTKEINTEDEDTVEGPFLDSEDLDPDEKISDFDGENIDMMRFNELPVTQTNEENLDNGEMFIDAEAFEYLLNQNKSNIVADSGKESLFLKFDPLFAKRMSAVTTDGVLASLAQLQRKQSTPTKTAQTPPKTASSPLAGPSNLNKTQDMDMNISEEYSDDLNVTVAKPMMVVPPAVNPVTPRNKSLTPNRSNRRSFTFTSPAMAVIDRLLSLSGNNSPLHDTTVTRVSREQNEADVALSQLRELLAEKEINVYNLKCESNELRDRLSTLEGQVKCLESESQDRLKKINQLNDTLVEKTKINRDMAKVVEEYERTIASLIAETAQDKKKHAEERIKLINERDEQTAHLASMEVSFSDLHSKYEKSKQIILTCKANEDVYKKSIKDFEVNLTKMQSNYELLKQHATSKLNHANQELEKINRSHEAEVLKFNAMIKRKELHITSLEESLTQKTKANDELTAICDELINKVGGTNFRSN